VARARHFKTGYADIAIASSGDEADKTGIAYATGKAA
jgi:hypothetical protein